MVSSNRHPARENEGWRESELACGDPCGGQVIPAATVVDQADDGLPHDRTSLFDRTLWITDLGFRTLSSVREDGFVGLERRETASRNCDHRPAVNRFRIRLATVGGNGFCWRPVKEKRGCKPSSGNDHGDQARAKQDKTGNGQGKETVRSEFFTHGTPPGRWLPSRLSRLLE
jgi:hypothetical protein